MNVWKWFGLNTRETRVEINKENQSQSTRRTLYFAVAVVICVALIASA